MIPGKYTVLHTTTHDSYFIMYTIYVWDGNTSEDRPS